MTRVPLSVLDLSPFGSGQTPADGLRSSIRLARAAEHFGYRRYWLAEHHFNPGVAGAAPHVLLAAVAAATTRIRVGTAATILGNYAPVQVAEAVGVVAALHPGRVDLGLGRSGARPPAVAGASTADRVVDGLAIPAARPLFAVDAPRFAAQAGLLRRTEGDGERFADDVADILAFFAGPHDVDGVTLEVTPASGQDVEVWIHGSTAGPSARLAGERGLPFGANYHVAPAFVLDAIAEYRSAFRPGKLAAPHVIVSVDVLVADTDERARALASGYGRWVHGIRTGGGAVPYPAPGDPSSALSPDEEEVVRDRLATRFVGSARTVVDALETLQRVTGADELLITTIAHDPAAREESYRLLAQAWASDTSTPRTDAGAPTTGRASDDRRIDVRLVRTSEYERAGEVTAQAYLASYGDLSEAYLASLRDVAARVRDGDVWVAVDRGGDILGSIWVARADRPLNPDIGRPGETDFRQLAVAAHARGRGIGAALTRHVVSLARERGSHRVVMNSGPEMTGAHALYAKLGFRRLPEREHARELEPGRVVTLLAFGYDLSPDPHETRDASEPRSS